MRSRKFKAAIRSLQGWYYVATGLWPLVSMGTFERVTGPKRDRWLVRMVGLLAFTIGVELVRSEREEREGSGWLAAASAASFGAIDTIYVARGTIGPIYLLDAALEAAFVAAAR